jgi:ribosomal protein S13
LTSTFYDPKNTLAVLDKESRKSLNRIFSQMASVNYQINEVTRVNIIRLFLIKSFRGKAQAFGKPSRGQRT